MQNKFAILVTGGAGYIGSHTVLSLLDSGWKVVVLDNLVTGFPWAVDERATFIKGAVDDESLTQRIINDHQIGAIMHFAGSVVVPESMVDPLKFYKNNTAASRTLIECAVAAGIRHFIFSSTAATYGEPQAIPIPEHAPTNPINPYGRSKLMTEEMLKDVSAAHPMNHIALRYFNVAGADPLQRSGQSTTGATHLIKVAVEAATGKREQVAIFGNDFDTPDGTGVRDYIHVSDLAAAHVQALELLMKEPKASHTLNCGYGHGYSVEEVLDAVDSLIDKPIIRKIEARRAGDPAVLVADNRAALEALAWEPMYDDINLIVKDALTWERGLLERSNRDG